MNRRQWLMGALGLVSAPTTPVYYGAGSETLRITKKLAMNSAYGKMATLDVRSAYPTELTTMKGRNVSRGV